MTLQLKRLLFSSFFVASMFLLWKSFDPIAPLMGQYFVEHRTLPDLYSDLNFLPAIAGILVAENAHEPSAVAIWVGFCLQWGLLGYGIGVLIFRKTNKAS